MKNEVRVKKYILYQRKKQFKSLMEDRKVLNIPQKTEQK